MADTPKLRIPFRIERGAALTVVQDSEEEVMQCVSALLRTTEGSRIEEPEYGIPDMDFEEGWVEEGGVQEAIEEWEPRAAYTVNEDMISDAVRVIQVEQNREASDG